MRKPKYRRSTAPVISATAWGCCIVFLGIRCCAIYEPQPRGEPPRYCTVVNHMVKSGGTSIKEQLASASRKEGHSAPGLCTSDNSTTDEQCSEALYNSSVITGYGELLRHPLEAIGRDCDFVTMMRHPISRLVSAFYYCPGDHDQQSRPTKWCGNRFYPESASSRLLDFAKNTKWAYMTYAEMMFGIHCKPGFVYCEKKYQVKKIPSGIGTRKGRQALTQMKEMLSNYTAVGIFEEWQLSMQLFDATVKSSVRKWDAGVSLNHGVDLVGRESLLQWAYVSPEINVALTADILLYEFAREVFKRQTSAVLGTVWDT
ncbi:unnamed protein product [Scytosiphon promiscuus]